MDARLREGIRLFNDQRFFESHEQLEDFYQQTEDMNKPFIEGLVQLAAAFRMFADFGEIKGPIRMIRQALIRFENYQPDYLQVRVKELSEAMHGWTRAAEAAGANPALSTIPKIAVQRFGLF